MLLVFICIFVYQVVDEMFKTAGFENKEDGALSFNDFKNIMEEHKHHLESATLDLKGIDVAAPATGPGTSGATKEPEITPAEGATDGGVSSKFRFGWNIGQSNLARYTSI